MKSHYKIFSLSLLISLPVFISCDRKEEPTPVPPPLTRQFQLQYNDAQDDIKISFATLDEDEVPFVYDWATAKSKAAVVHFGLTKFIIPGLVSTKSVNAPLFYADAQNGVAQWDQNVLAGITFDNGPAPNINFDNLTRKDIANGVPDGSFGADDADEKFFSQEGTIIRFIQTDVNNVTRYKGYFKIIAIDNGNPTSVTIQAKYIAK